MKITTPSNEITILTLIHSLWETHEEWKLKAIKDLIKDKNIRKIVLSLSNDEELRRFVNGH
jgi:hypothetical protein